MANISKHTAYCNSVKRAIDNNEKPKTWDEWDNRVVNFGVEDAFKPVS